MNNQSNELPLKNKLSIMSNSVRQKLLMAFALMTLLPMLVLIYILSGYMSVVEQHIVLSNSVLMVIVFFIAWLGFLVVKAIIDPVLDMSVEARVIAEGNFNRQLSAYPGNEIGELADTFNVFIKRIRSNMDELRDYSEKTKEINDEIHRKMVVLSGLFQVNELVSSNVGTDKIIDAVIEKLTQSHETGFAVLYLADDNDKRRFIPKKSVNLPADFRLNDPFNIGEGFLGSAVIRRKVVVLDSSTPRSSDDHHFKVQNNIVNAVIVPVIQARDLIGILLTGNSIPGYVYTNEDVDMIKIFVRQLAIMIDHENLAQRCDNRSLFDGLTKLYGMPYMTVRLDEEITSALYYQKACALIALEIDGISKYDADTSRKNDILIKTADIIKQKYHAPLDKAARLGGGRFAILLPEKNKKLALSIAEDIRQSFADEFKDAGLTVSQGIGENPMDGMTSDAVMGKALENLEKAKSSGGNKIEF